MGMALCSFFSDARIDFKTFLFTLFAESLGFSLMEISLTWPASWRPDILTVSEGGREGGRRERERGREGEGKKEGWEGGKGGREEEGREGRREGERREESVRQGKE